MKVGVLVVGFLGANSTTFCSGLLAMSSGMIKDEGCITINDNFKHLNLITSKDIIFGGWDTIDSNLYECAAKYKIIPEGILTPLKNDLITFKSISSITSKYFDHSVVLNGSNYHIYNDLNIALLKVKEDIKLFKERNYLDHCILLYMGSPQRTLREVSEHSSYEGILSLIQKNKVELISPSILYSIAALQENCAIIDFTPNQTLSLSGIQEAAIINGCPIAGRDGSTGQTFMKSLIAEMFHLRNFKIEGWFSTNIIGNNDGKVLSDLDFVETKLHDKKSVLEPILGYSDFDHIVDINYYKPRGDNKESWDNIDFTGMFNLPMTMKINWQGRDAILAAPMIYDLIKFIAHEKIIGNKGLINHLGWYFKNPLGCSNRGFWQLYSLLVNNYQTTEQNGKGN